MKLITDGNDNYSLIDDDGDVYATTMYSGLASYFLDLEQINTLLPIKDDDEFEIQSVGIKNGNIDKMYLYLKRSVRTLRNDKLNEILK